MNIDRAVLTLAGSLTLVGTILAATVSPWFLLLTGFVGANLLQSSFTGFCPAASILRRFGLQSGCAFNPQNTTHR